MGFRVIERGTLLELFENYATDEKLLGETHLRRTGCFQSQVVWFDLPEPFHRLWPTVRRRACSVFCQSVPSISQFYVIIIASLLESIVPRNLLHIFRCMNRDVGPLSHTFYVILVG